MKYKLLLWACMRKGESMFGGSFEPTNFDERIKGISGRPEVIVRLGELIDDVRTEQISKEKERYRQSERNFEELRGFGVAVPAIETVFAEEDGGLRPCIRTERILGNNLSKTDFGDVADQAHLVSELGICFDGLVSYLEVKKNAGGLFIGDLKNVQFVFGHKFNEEDDRAYLVDVDPFFNRREPGKPVELKFFSTLSGVLAMMDAWVAKWQKSHSDELVPHAWKTVIDRHLELIATCMSEASQDQFTQRFVKSFQDRIYAFVDLTHGRRAMVKFEGDLSGWGGQEA